MRLTINGHLYDLRFTNRGIPRHDDGNCEQPVSPPGVAKIRVRPNLDRDRKREVLLHELLHAARWSMSESAVTQIAEDIAVALKLAGF